jgi:hypothetical protein
MDGFLAEHLPFAFFIPRGRSETTNCTPLRAQLSIDEVCVSRFAGSRYTRMAWRPRDAESNSFFECNSFFEYPLRLGSPAAVVRVGTGKVVFRGRF